MNITLLRPCYHTHLITPPLGLGYLSSFLRRRGHSVNIVDALNEELGPGDAALRCADSDAVGITALTDFFPQVIETSRCLKAAGKIVFIGGPHASILPGETLAATGADFVVVGEGEQTLLEAADAMAEGRPVGTISGVWSGNGSDFVPRALVPDLDKLPFPDWGQMDPRRYQKAPHGAFIKHFPVAPVTSTRGCPFECTFCASPRLWEKKIRFRSPENVVDEIEQLVRDFQVREIHFEDDNLTLRKSHIEGICREIIARNLSISWAAPNGVRADTLDPALLKLMKLSGCYMLAFGVESGNQEILDRAKKRVTLERLRKAIGDAAAAGIITQGFFIFGLPGETEATIAETIRFAKSSRLDRAQFLLLDVMPGCEIWDELGGRQARGEKQRSYQQVTWCPPGVSRQVLQQAPGRAFRSFFFRPRPLYRLVRMIRPSQIKFVIRRIRDFEIF